MLPVEIVDAHHHIWRQRDLPWLQGKMQPRIFGPYEPIMRDYGVEEYIRDAEESGVVASIYVQTNWPTTQAVDEVAWVESCAAAHGKPTAIVAYCDLVGSAVEETLERQALASSRMRGIRMQLHWHKNLMYRFAERPDLCCDDRVRHSLEKVCKRGWLFELQVFPDQMNDAAQLVADLPDLNFVLVHAGMPETDTGSAFTKWRAAIETLANHQNCYTKLSGQGTFLHRVDDSFIGNVVRACLDVFGAERCMFGSNFPIEKIWSDFSGLMRGFDTALAGLPDDVMRKLFFENANRVYKLGL